MNVVTPAIPPPDRSRLPRLPPELYLEIFSYLGRATLFTLHLITPTFYELIAPLFYETCHLDDLLLLLAAPPLSPGLDRNPSLAFDSVRTLHITRTSSFPTSVRIIPRMSLPNLDHVCIHHIYGEDGDGDEEQEQELVSLWKYSELLSDLNPLSITTSFSSLYGEVTCSDFQLCGPSTKTFTASWTRLNSVIFHGGSLHEFVGPGLRNPEPAFMPTEVTGLLHVTYDFRSFGTENTQYFDWIFWLSERMALAYDFDVLVRVSSKKVQAFLQLEFGLTETGTRIRIELESGDEGEEVLKEMKRWRDRGM